MTDRPPKHAYELRIDVGGETWERTLQELERLTDHVRDHGPECNMSSGGAGTASQVFIATREVSPEQYREELEAWRLRRKENR